MENLSDWITDRNQQGLHILEIGRHQASQTHLNEEEQEECASLFALEVFQMQEPSLEEILTRPYAQAWLHACARYVTVSYCRALGKERKRCISLDAILDSKETDLALELPDTASSPETLLFEKEFRRLLHHVEGLSANQQRLLIRRLVDEASYKTLAPEFGTTAHALRQKYSGAKRRLLAFLKAQGWREDDWFTP